MSRWNETITLVSYPDATQDEMLAWHKSEPVKREVFCDPYIMGSMVQAQLRSSEIRINSGDTVPDLTPHQMAMVLIRKVDYEGEKHAIYNDAEMEIISYTSIGENYKLILGEKLGNE